MIIIIAIPPFYNHDYDDKNNSISNSSNSDYRSDNVFELMIMKITYIHTTHSFTDVEHKTLIFI